MSSANEKGKIQPAAVVSVNTEILKSKLNNLYGRVHGSASAKTLMHDGIFEYLWDLKELALMEGKPCVELPNSWLDDLETEAAQPRYH